MQGPVLSSLYPLPEGGGQDVPQAALLGESRVEEAKACIGRAALRLLLGAPLGNQPRGAFLSSDLGEHIWPEGAVLLVCIVLAARILLSLLYFQCIIYCVSSLKQAI